jgi:acetyl esterase
MSMAVRTRLLGQVLKHSGAPIEEVTDYRAHRAARLALQRTVIGRSVFGAVDRTVKVEQVEVSLEGRTLPGLLYRPSAVGSMRPAIINFHGGGWVQGNPEQSQWLASRVAARTGAIVISPSYRLAPEHPFPAAIDDAWETVLWVIAHAARWGIDPNRIAVMGDSAGGNLAAAVALMARDRGGPNIAAQVLIYPAVEMYDKYPSELQMPDEPVLTSANMSAFVHLYLADAYGTDDFRASPIRAASHAGVAPAFILTAERDPLLDSGAMYRQALVGAGVPVKYREYAGAVHGFLSIPGAVPVASDALADIVAFVGARLIARR